MNRATIAIVGSTALIALGILSLKEACQAIDPTTIVFLLGMMIVNAHLAYAGFFQLTLVYQLRLTRSPFGLLVVLSVGSGIVSAFFLNDIVVIVLTPLTLKLTARLQLNPIPYLLALAAATNIGSVATLSGNPQNILIGSFSGISYLEFFRVLAPVALMGLVVQIALLYRFYPEVRLLQPVADNFIKVRDRIYKPLLTKSLVITAGMLASFVLGVPLNRC